MNQEQSDRTTVLTGETGESVDYWIRELVHHLEVEGVKIDLESVVQLSDLADETVVDPAGPLTTFLIGYVAGLAEASGQADFATAHRAATRVAESLLARRRAAVG